LTGIYAEHAIDVNDFPMNDVLQVALMNIIAAGKFKVGE
jgi:hypothetical protein